MDPKIKAEWLKALRSGKYKQARGLLANEQGFCCIGVLYDVAFDGWWIRGSDGEWLTEEDRETYLSDEERRAVGLPNGHEKHLARLNDKGASFPEIADWIERNL